MRNELCATSADRGDELRQRLGVCLKCFLDNLVEIATLVQEAYDEKIDISDLSVPFVQDLRRLACGQIRKDVFMTFLGEPQLFRKVASLPLADQDAIVAGKPVRVMEPDCKGDFREMPVSALSGAEVKQVFSKRGLRTDPEQIAYLRDLQQPRRPEAQRPEIELDLNPKDPALLVGGLRIPLADLAHYVSQLTIARRRKR